MFFQATSLASSAGSKRDLQNRQQQPNRSRKSSTNHSSSSNNLSKPRLRLCNYWQSILTVGLLGLDLVIVVGLTLANMDLKRKGIEE